MTFEEELLMDEEEDRREIAFIRQQLPNDLKELYSDEQLLWMIDTLTSYYVESGLLDSDDDEIEIDMEQVASHLCQQADAEGMPQLQPDEVRFVVEADLDFQELTIDN
jgi:hypothetical protein